MGEGISGSVYLVRQRICGLFFDFRSQIRGQAVSQCPCRVIPRQPGEHTSHRLCRFLYITAGAVFFRCGLIGVSLTQSGGIRDTRIHRFRDPQPLNIPLSADNVGHLAAEVPDNLNLLQPFLFFLFVKHRKDAAVGVVRVTAQACGILFLVCGVADNPLSLRDRGFGGSLRIPLITALA